MKRFSFTFTLLFCLLNFPGIIYADNIIFENDRYQIGVVSNATDSEALDLQISITDKQKGFTFHQDESIVFTTSTEIKDAFFVAESAFMLVFDYDFHNGMLLSSVSQEGRLAVLEFRVGRYTLDPDRKIMVHSNWGYGRQYLSQIDLSGTIEYLDNVDGKKPQATGDIIVDRTIFDVYERHPEAAVSDIQWAGEGTFKLELSEGVEKLYYLISGVTPKGPDGWDAISIRKIHNE